MSVYKIYQGGEEINRIVADEEFVEEYCPKHGYTYELEPEPEPVDPPEPPEPTEQETTDAMLVDHEYRITMLEMGL